MLYKKHILTLVFITFLSIGNVFSQETPKQPKETPKKNTSTDKKNDAPRVKSPIEIAIELCKEAESQKKLGKHEDAILTFTNALETLPEHYPAFIGRAGTKFLKLDFQGALSDYDAAIIMMENLKEKHETQAKIKKVFGDKNGEKIELDLANEILPALAEAYFQRGNVKQFMDDKSGACSDIKKAKELGQLRTDEAMKNICGS